MIRGLRGSIASESKLRSSESPAGVTLCQVSPESRDKKTPSKAPATSTAGSDAACATARTAWPESPTSRHDLPPSPLKNTPPPSPAIPRVHNNRGDHPIVTFTDNSELFPIHTSIARPKNSAIRRTQIQRAGTRWIARQRAHITTRRAHGLPHLRLHPRRANTRTHASQDKHHDGNNPEGPV